MVRFAQISFKLYGHVVCSPFESRAYFINKKHIQNMELNLLIGFLCTREYDMQGGKVFVKLLSMINVNLRKKTRFSPLYSYQKFFITGKRFRERTQATERVF